MKTIAGALLLALLACAGATSGTCPTGQNCFLPAVAQGADAGPLPICIIGFWLGPGSACKQMCPSDGGGLPECRAADCSLQSFAGYEDSGVLASGSFMASQSAATFSSFGPPDLRKYAVETDGIVLDPGTRTEHHESLTCSATQTVANGFLLLVRASAGLSTELTLAVSDGGWRAQPYHP